VVYGFYLTFFYELRDKKAPTQKEVKNVEAGIVNVLFIAKSITTESSISIWLIDKKGQTKHKAPLLQALTLLCLYDGFLGLIVCHDSQQRPIGLHRFTLASSWGIL